MKALGRPSGSARRAGNPRRRAFTLTELLVASTVFLFVVGGVISSHIFGMRMLEPITARQEAADESRKTMNTLANDIRAARTVKIGTGTATLFTEAGVNARQRGSALQVYPTTNSAVFVRYFRDPTSKDLLRITNGTAQATLVAGAIRNTYPFRLEDYAGNILTNDQMNSVVAITFQFLEVGSDGTPVRWARYFRSYKWKTRIYRRTLQ